jgi:hypothetical protein
MVRDSRLPNNHAFRYLVTHRHVADAIAQDDQKRLCEATRPRGFGSTGFTTGFFYHHAGLHQVQPITNPHSVSGLHDGISIAKPT